MVQEGTSIKIQNKSNNRVLKDINIQLQQRRSQQIQQAYLRSSTNRKAKPSLNNKSPSKFSLKRQPSEGSDSNIQAQKRKDKYGKLSVQRKKNYSLISCKSPNDQIVESEFKMFSPPQYLKQNPIQRVHKFVKKGSVTEFKKLKSINQKQKNYQPPAKESGAGQIEQPNFQPKRLFVSKKTRQSQTKLNEQPYVTPLEVSYRTRSKKRAPLSARQDPVINELRTLKVKPKSGISAALLPPLPVNHNKFRSLSANGLAQIQQRTKLQSRMQILNNIIDRSQNNKNFVSCGQIKETNVKGKQADLKDCITDCETNAYSQQEKKPILKNGLSRLLKRKSMSYIENEKKNDEIENKENREINNSNQKVNQKQERMTYRRINKTRSNESLSKVNFSDQIQSITQGIVPNDSERKDNLINENLKFVSKKDREKYVLKKMIQKYKILNHKAIQKLSEKIQEDQALFKKPKDECLTKDKQLLVNLLSIEKPINQKGFKDLELRQNSNDARQAPKIINRVKSRPDSPIPKIQLKIQENNLKTDYIQENTVTKYAFSTKVGIKPTNQMYVNQDSFMTNPNIDLIKKENYKHFFGVCDGHGSQGHNVSKLIAKLLPRVISQELSDKRGQEQQDKLTANDYQDVLEKAYLKCDQLLMRQSVDTQYTGSTVCGVLIDGTRVHCANLGDSRAIKVSFRDQNQQTDINQDLVVKPLCQDHKPSLLNEKKRILDAGGRVEQSKDKHNSGEFVGPDRVWLANKQLPGLAMSRSMGDRVAHSVGVISLPEVSTFSISRSDKFIVIGSDGLYQFLSNEKIAELIIPFYHTNQIENAANEIVKAAFREWRKQESVVDDITALVIFLDPSMAYNPQKVEQTYYQNQQAIF